MHVSKTQRRTTALGRYDLSGATSPPNGLAEVLAPRRNISARTARGAIQDRYNPADRTRVRIRCSLLEDELSHGRIEQSWFDFGREMECAYEAAACLASGSNWAGGNSADPIEAQGLAGERIIEASDRVLAIEAQARAAVGDRGLGFLSRVLRDGFNFQRLTVIGQMKGSRADVMEVAKRFRWLLKECADHRAHVGPDRTRMRSCRS